MNCERVKNKELIKALTGAVRFLSGTFVYISEDYSVQENNFTVSGNTGNNRWIRYAAWLRKNAGDHLVHENHLRGNWPGFINYTPRMMKSPLKSLFLVTDYNLFTTVSTAIPLFLFSDELLPEENRVIDKIHRQVNANLQKYQRKHAYCFWPIKGSGKDSGMIKPANIPEFLLDFRFNIHRITGLLGLQFQRESKLLYQWLKECYQNRQNSMGGGALFNIPDDADNTSMAFIYKHYMSERYTDVPLPETNALLSLGEFVDQNRSKSDRHNSKTGGNTGAFLTWLKDEDLPVFDNPSEGIIPMGTNNVDCVINANVLCALTMYRLENMKGYQNAVDLMIKYMEENIWSLSSLYYPNKLQFPHAVSRAWREGGIKNPCLERALSKLLADLLREQNCFEKAYPSMTGAFPCGADGNYLYSTALFLVSLLNLGHHLAEEAEKVTNYKRAVDHAVDFILKNKQTTKTVNSGHPQLPGNEPLIYWNSGVLYSSSIRDLAEWRSDEQTTALVAEGLAKYLLGYDSPDNQLPGGQLQLQLINNQTEITIL